MRQEPVRVVIEVSGGVVQAVYAGNFVEVVLVDYDSIEEGDEAGTISVFPESEMDSETAAHVEAARKEAADAQVSDAPEC